MKVHANAPLGPKGRLRMVGRVLERGWSLAAAAEAAGVSERTCSKWVARYRIDGEAGLVDRSSAPNLIPHRTPDELVEVIVLLRRLRMTGAEIAFCLAMAVSTVSAVLLRVGLGKLSRLEPPEPPNRYERRHPGELIHIDVKKLGVITGIGHRITVSAGRSRPTVASAAAEPRRAGSLSTSASRTPLAWPTSRCSRMRRPRPRSRFSSVPSPSTRVTASLSSGS